MAVEIALPRVSTSTVPARFLKHPRALFHHSKPSKSSNLLARISSSQSIQPPNFHHYLDISHLYLASLSQHPILSSISKLVVNTIMNNTTTGTASWNLGISRADVEKLLQGFKPAAIEGRGMCRCAARMRQTGTATS